MECLDDVTTCVKTLLSIHKITKEINKQVESAPREDEEQFANLKELIEKRDLCAVLGAVINICISDTAVQEFATLVKELVLVPGAIDEMCDMIKRMGVENHEIIIVWFKLTENVPDEFPWDFTMSIPLADVILGDKIRQRFFDDDLLEVALTPFQLLFLSNNDLACQMMLESGRNIGDWSLKFEDLDEAPTLVHLVTLTESYRTLAIMEHLPDVRKVINRKDSSGLTPLHWAATRASFDGYEAGSAYHIIRKLIHTGAYRSIESPAGNIPLEFMSHSNAKCKEGVRIMELCTSMLDPHSSIKEFAKHKVPRLCAASNRGATDIPRVVVEITRACYDIPCFD